MGEALTDIVVADNVTTEAPGGSPMNVAVGLGRLGQDVTFLTAVGDDRRGGDIRRHLTESGVRLAPSSVSMEATSTATATVQADGSARYDFDVAWSVSPPSGTEGYDVVHTGSIALFLEPGCHAVEHTIGAASRTSLVTLDPNIRPALVGWPRQAVTRFERLLPFVDVVKLSDEDAHFLYDGATPAEVLTRICSSGVSLAAITNGSEGSLLRSGDATVELPARQVEPVDTIGAGDAYMAGLIHGLVSDGHAGHPQLPLPALGADDLRRIGQVATVVAGATVERRGADLPTLAELGERMTGR